MAPWLQKEMLILLGQAIKRKHNLYRQESQDFHHVLVLQTWPKSGASPALNLGTRALSVPRKHCERNKPVSFLLL
jgi:hypothetical protein